MRPASRRHPIQPGRAAAGLALGLSAALAGAQSDQAALFVANDGNNEGSVTSFTLDESGQPVFEDRLLTSDNDDDPGTNAFSIDLTPNGRFLAVGHAAGGTSPDRQLTILSVQPDASLLLVEEFTTPATPLDLRWLSDELLAVTRTNLGGTNEAIVYRFTPGEAASLEETDRGETGTFSSELAVHPSLNILYANDTFSGNRITAFSWDEAGQLTEQDVTFTSGFPIAPVVSNDGSLLYAFGGISGDGQSVLGFDVAGDGTLTELTGSPFFSPGDSPKNGAFSEDDAYLFVGHGTDSTVRSFSVDSESGGLTSTGSSYDVGSQGTLGELAVLADMLYLTDSSTIGDDETGVQSLSIDPDTGAITPSGPIVPSQGISPDAIVAWGGTPCEADVTGDGTLDSEDFLAFIDLFAAGDPEADFTGDGKVTSADFLAYIDLFAAGCP